MRKNNKLRKIEYISIILLIILMCFSPALVFASQKSDLKSEESSIDKKIDETNTEIAGVKSQMSNTLNQINNYNSQISTYESEISALQNQITTLQSDITQKEANIKEQEEKYNQQKSMLEKKLVAMYENGTTSYLDMLLSSESLADFISKYYILEQLTEYDNDLLGIIENTKNKIESEKKELEAAKAEVETSKASAESKKNSLAVIVSEKKTLVNNLSAEEKQLEEKLEEFEKDKKDVQAKLAAIAAQEAAAAAAAAKKKNSSGSSSSGAVAINASGFASPLAGRTKANITCGYYGYSGHTGVDWAIAGGTPILASKSGTVVISTALRSASGGYRSYGEYVSISHGDGTATLYAHMSKRAVGPGETVSQGQVIGYVGSTGKATGNHLHFELFVGGKRVNPASYLP